MENQEFEARLLLNEAEMMRLKRAVFGLEEPEAAPAAAVPMPPGRYRVVAGTIRGTPGGTWGLIEDAGHTSLGIRGVSVSGNRVIITYDFTAKKVISLMATPDEYYAQMGVSCGASVGKSNAAIYFNRRPATGYADPMSLRSGNANVWIYGIFEV